VPLSTEEKMINAEDVITLFSNIQAHAVAVRRTRALR
jgi:hypothetical protein